MGPYAVVEYNLNLSQLQSRLHHIYHGQPHARVDLILRSGTEDLASVDVAHYMAFSSSQASFSCSV
jgi:hypothetical protein